MERQRARVVPVAQPALLYAASATITLWGIAHLFPTNKVVRGFGPISQANRRILTMAWVSEALALCFVGVLVALATWQQAGSVVLCRACAAFLVVLAGLTLFTGGRTAVLPIKLCPMVKLAAALLLWAGSA